MINESYSNDKIFLKTFSVKLNEDFLHEMSLFISNRGYEMVPIDICIEINDIEMNMQIMLLCGRKCN